jgi:hypothetical protein
MYEYVCDVYNSVLVNSSGTAGFYFLLEFLATTTYYSNSSPRDESKSRASRVGRMQVKVESLVNSVSQFLYSASLSKDVSL